MKQKKITIDTPLSVDAFEILQSSINSLSYTLYKQLLPRGMTVSQFGVLKAIYTFGPMCQKELSVFIVKTSGNLTTVIDNLEKRKLVQRKPVKGDRRYYNIVLTPKGQKVIKELYPQYASMVEDIMGCLTQAQSEQLKCLCEKLLNTPEKC